ncbi:MAG TPA: hypothetical protein VHW01_05270 [Polyangiaceae bacterium]|jgi:hypothetical protein|nr:hypothetical protein [Polyangiaceae bacterium]
MQITIPNLTTDADKAAHGERVAGALATQSALWAVAPGHELTVPRATLATGDEVLLNDLTDHAGALSLRDRMAALVAQGVVVRAAEHQHRRADVAAADSAAVRFHVAGSAIITIAHMDGRTPCVHTARQRRARACCRVM